MRKITPAGVNLIILSILIICWAIAGISAYREHRQSNEPAQDIADYGSFILDSNITGIETMAWMETEEEIIIEFLSVNYLEDKEYLMRVEVGGEQVGIIYFDENGEIRFDGDKEKFEEVIFKAFDARRAK